MDSQTEEVTALVMDVGMSGLHRLVMLQHIAGSRWDFAATRKNNRIWDALIGDWDWPAGPLSSEEGAAEIPVRMTRPVIEDICDLIRVKLSQKAPKDPRLQCKECNTFLDTRWNGATGVVMMRLYDKFARLLDK